MENVNKLLDGLSKEVISKIQADSRYQEAEDNWIVTEDGSYINRIAWREFKDVINGLIKEFSA